MKRKWFVEGKFWKPSTNHADIKPLIRDSSVCGRHADLKVQCAQFNLRETFKNRRHACLTSSAMMTMTFFILSFVLYLWESVASHKTDIAYKYSVGTVAHYINEWWYFIFPPICRILLRWHVSQESNWPIKPISV